MRGSPILPLILATTCLVVAGARLLRAPLPIVMVTDSAPAPVPIPHSLEAEFARTMTPDDVARGVWALALGQGPGLTEDQRVSLLPAARQARDTRHALDRITAERRDVRERLRTTGGAIADVLVASGWTP